MNFLKSEAFCTFRELKLFRMDDCCFYKEATSCGARDAFTQLKLKVCTRNPSPSIFFS